MLYLVSYDVEGETDYDRINKGIRNKIDKHANKILNTQWIVTWNKDAKRLGNAMLRILAENSSIFVNSLEKEDIASYNIQGDNKYGTELQYPPPTKLEEMNETVDRLQRS